ncbi:MAG: hypothetical protein K2K83_00555, partial [Rikenella sp.]|nr:hypothetical protein [Rikenella sp.]
HKPTVILLLGGRAMLRIAEIIRQKNNTKTLRIAITATDKQKPGERLPGTMQRKRSLRGRLQRKQIPRTSPRRRRMAIKKRSDGQQNWPIRTLLRGDFVSQKTKLPDR